MKQRTIAPGQNPGTPAEVQCSENAFPLTFLVLALGLVTGAFAAVIAGDIVQVVAPAVVRTLMGA